MANRNITIKLPADLIRRTKAHAAERGMSIDTLVQELLEGRVFDPVKARRAGQALLALAKKGPFFSGDPRSVSREDLHERR